MLISIKFTLFFVKNRNNKYGDEIDINEKNYNTTENEINNINKYVEITIGSDIDSNQLNTLTNDYNDIKITNNNANKYKTKIIKNTNKNIWVSSILNNKKSTLLSDSENLTNSNETSNDNNFKNNINNLYKLGIMDSYDSDLSESDILFEYN